MSSAHRQRALLAPLTLAAVSGCALAFLTGCGLVPRARLEACRAESSRLAAVNRSQTAEIENLRVHANNTLRQLTRTEEELALLEERAGLDRTRLANYQEERNVLHEHVETLLGGREGVPGELSERFAEISRRFPELQFDARLGFGKLDTDIMFDSGKTELKPGAQRVLGELVRILNSPQGRDLKIMIVGHTDDRRIVDKAAHEQYPSNWHLSSARALAVSDEIRRLGLENARIGLASFASHQPVAPNVGPSDRQKNRRVEVFVMGPTTPVVGWTESIPSVY